MRWEERLVAVVSAFTSASWENPILLKENAKVVREDAKCLGGTQYFCERTHNFFEQMQKH